MWPSSDSLARCIVLILLMMGGCGLISRMFALIHNCAGSLRPANVSTLTPRQFRAAAEPGRCGGGVDMVQREADRWLQSFVRFRCLSNIEPETRT